MLPQFTDYKHQIDTYLTGYLESKLPELQEINTWGRDAVEKLKEFVTRGKTIRGGLVMLMSEMYGYSDTDTRLRIASSVELLHSGLLIHDDIMDNDEFRRGKDSIYHSYDAQSGIPLADRKDLGKNLALCAGDAAFFLAFGCLDTIGDFKVLRDVLPMFSREFSAVCMAQMQDVSFSRHPEIPSQQDILTMYQYKTGRYTFSLPMTLGATMAEAPESEIHKLQQLGVEMGILFQVKDDELNLFGNPDTSGKPVGSDIREAKKTLYISFLLEKASAKDKKIIRDAYAHGSLTESQSKKMYLLFETYTVKQTMKDYMQHRSQKASEIINSLHIREKNNKDLQALVTFLHTRES